MFASFMYMALLNVKTFAFFFVTYLSIGWPLIGKDKAYFIAVERISAELLTFILALAAVSVLQWWSARQDEHHHVRAQQSSI